MTNSSQSTNSPTAESLSEEAVGIFPLKNLHQVLAEVAFEPEESEEAGPMTHGDYRVEAEVKARASIICKQNGGDLSKFVRGCLRTLVREYR